MYAGKVVERADVRHDLRQAASPVHEGPARARSRARREARAASRSSRASSPTRSTCPTGCLFKRRCPYAMPICDTRAAAPDGRARSHVSRCWLTPERRAARASAPTPRPRSPRPPAAARPSRLERATDAPAADAHERARRTSDAGVRTPPPIDRVDAPSATPRRTGDEVAARGPRASSSTSPIRGGVLGVSKVGAVRAVDGVSFDVRPRRDARPGGRVGLRQDDPRARSCCGLHPGDVGRGDVQGPDDLRRPDAAQKKAGRKTSDRVGQAEGPAQGRPGRVPGPVRVASTRG